MKTLTSWLRAFACALALLLAWPAFAATTAEVRQELITNLAADGALTPAETASAVTKYVTEAAAKEKVDEGWSKLFTWINFIKLLAIALALWAFAGVIRLIIQGLWNLITAVPVIIYQGFMLTLTLMGTFAPEAFWASQAQYIMLFCVFANLLIIGWIIAMHERLQEALERLFNLGIPVGVVTSFWLMIYFGSFALSAGSPVIGFFAVVAFSALFGFGIMYAPGVMYLDVKDRWLPALIISHILVLCAYAVASKQGIPQLALFAAGFEYYCAIALGVGLLIGTAPWGGQFKYLALAIIALGLAMFGYSFYDMHAIGAIIGIFAVLIFLEWVLYVGWHGGMIIGAGLTAIILYVTALVIEGYGSAILRALGF